MPCFIDDSDRQLYLTALREASLRYHCAIHAYVLMTNHVHLLVTPETKGAVSRMMQGIGRIYVAELMLVIAAPEHCGRAASSRAWSTERATFWHATATSK